MDLVRNEKGEKVLELADRAEQRMLRWFGHVENMKGEQLVKHLTGSDVIDVREYEGGTISQTLNWI